MKLHNMLQEMGAFGMDKIRKNFFNLIKELGLPTKDYDMQEVSSGSAVIILKEKKPFRTVPISQAMNKSYLSDILTDISTKGK